MTPVFVLSLSDVVGLTILSLLAIGFVVYVAVGMVLHWWGRWWR